jgi:hypothetical protein
MILSRYLHGSGDISRFFPARTVFRDTECISTRPKIPISGLRFLNARSHFPGIRDLVNAHWKNTELTGYSSKRRVIIRIQRCLIAGNTREAKKRRHNQPAGQGILSRYLHGSGVNQPDSGNMLCFHASRIREGFGIFSLSFARSDARRYIVAQCGNLRRIAHLFF